MEKFYIEQWIKNKTSELKLKKLSEINAKLDDFIPTESMVKFKLPKIKSLDNLHSKSLLNPNKEDVDISCINEQPSNRKSDNEQSHTFLTGINETHEYEFIKEITNENENSSFNYSEEGFLDESTTKKYLDSSSRQINNHTISVTKPKEERGDNSANCVNLETDEGHISKKVPKKTKFEAFEVDSPKIKRERKKSALKKESTVPKLPKMLKFECDMNTIRESQMWTDRKPKEEYFNGPKSQLSLSIKYKIEELESSRAGYCPDLEIQNKRIHQTITKNKKKLLYLIKSCEDFSQQELNETQVYKKSLVKQDQIMNRANSRLKEKCNGSNPMVFYVPPDPRRLKEYLDKQKMMR